ncbi:unnamed protein product [Rangifer tarandus platyrhynchus]|uniref:Uncharacterized protein n=1 Tax=Rangifer tarandus platyrhynchus TaxID=3082113 RepID=A0ABN8YHX6_RANTA|nr:unnamed protein product [Rangifer tarandus platyrhynchus]
MLVVVSRPQTDPSAGALGGLDDHRKHVRARTRGEAEARTHTLLPGPRGDPATPLPATNPRAENTSARQFTLACPRKQKSKSRAWKQPKRPSPVRDAHAAHGSWRRRGKRKHWSRSGETAVTPLAEVRSLGAPGERHVVTVSSEPTSLGGSLRLPPPYVSTHTQADGGDFRVPREVPPAPAPGSRACAVGR